MQNQLPFTEEITTPLDLFISKIKIAYKVITSKKSIIIIDKNHHIFGHDKTEVINSASYLVHTLSRIRHQEAVISATVNELIAK